MREVPFTALGTGPPVVLIHGLGGFKESWGDLPRMLARAGFRTLAVDLPGGGGAARPRRLRVSSHLLAEILTPWLRRLGPVHLLGHSLGAQVAAVLAGHSEAAVRSLSMLAPVIVPRGLRLPRGVQDVLSVPAIGPRLAQVGISRSRRRPGRCRASLLAATGDPGRLRAGSPEDLLLQEAADRLTRIDLRGYTTWASSALRRGGLVGAALADAPVLTVVGTRDPLCPHQDIARLARALAEHQGVRLRGVGHFPHLEAPADTATAVVAHLRDACAGASA